MRGRKEWWGAGGWAASKTYAAFKFFDVSVFLLDISERVLGCTYVT
jgi:hypothetical protein